MFSTNHPLYEEVAAAFYSKKAAETTHKLNPKNSGGLSGKVEKNDCYIPQSKLSFPLDSKKMPDIEDDQSIR
jgi:5'-3' exoribonuclease 2